MFVQDYQSNAMFSYEKLCAKVMTFHEMLHANTCLMKLYLGITGLFYADLSFQPFIIHRLPLAMDKVMSAINMLVSLFSPP